MADDPIELPAKDRREADRRTSGRTGVLIGVVLAGVSIALTVGFLEVLTLTGVVDYRSVLGTPIDEPWSHPDNLLDPRLLHIHAPYYRQRFARAPRTPAWNCRAIRAGRSTWSWCPLR